MINILRKEPIARRLTYIAICSVILAFSIFTIFQYNNLKNIYLEQSEINARIVGELVAKHPKNEIDIVNAIYTKDNRNLSLGKEILNKFGYDENYGMYQNVNFQQHLKYFLVNNLVIFVILMILFVFIIATFMKYAINRLLNVSNKIESIINNTYIIEDDFKEEGVFNRIFSDLNKLSRSVTLKINDLDREKESIKELVTDISHQLKTPLASLKLYNSLLSEEDLDKKEREEFLETNEMSINKLHNLIESLVNISRLEASMINIKKENKSIKNTIENAINSVRLKANQKNIKVNMKDFKDININHDSRWTEESIFNVLDNGTKYTKENGEIKVLVSETINFVRIDIEDNGIGIDKSNFNNIFKRFYRSEEVENIEGSGVGLYLTRKILERQGGNIIVSSKKRQGSKFSLFLTKL